MSKRDELLSFYSDLYKDVNGFRPRQGTDWTDAKMQAEVDRLLVSLDELMEADYQLVKEKLCRFTDRLDELLTFGAISYDISLRWLMQSEDVEDQWDFDNFASANGLIGSMWYDKARDVFDRMYIE
jgi:hypothetical protein